jgi:hypothetical protein
MALSEAKIRNAKSSAQVRKLGDGRGLQPRVTPAGESTGSWLIVMAIM